MSTDARQTVPVDLGSRSYEVLVGRDLLKDLGTEMVRLFGKGRSVVIITDSNVGPLYAARAAESLRESGFEIKVTITVQAGEAAKSLRTAEDVCARMAQAGINRKSLAVALGGGVIGDLAGFCAAIYQRGIPYVQAPTTVLSQVDSSVGGKTGVNLAIAKNSVGCFHQPRLVIADIATLGSLPKREWNEGFAEIIKHAAIRDAAMFDAIDEILDGSGDMTALIARNVAIKARIVEADEFETKSLRALLNFGHTIGHAIETVATYGHLLHGEAISMGLVAAARLSVTHGELSPQDSQRIISLLGRFSLPTSLPDGMKTEELIRSLKRDKKFEDGQVRFVLLKSAGDAFVSDKITLHDIEQAIEELRAKPTAT
jgi:3-dehydroquinate synthase